MKIDILKEIEFSELVQKIRDVPLMRKTEDDPIIKVYENAHINIRKNLSPHELNPTTLYLLRKNLEFQRNLRNYMLEEYKIDTLNLDRALEIRNEKGEERCLAPPMIEVTPRYVKFQKQENEIAYDHVAKLQIQTVMDGAHRVYLAKELGINFTGIWIHGADERFPVYAHPNEWSQIKIFDKDPKTKEEKKYYSREDCYSLYRNFEDLGTGKPRGVGK